jgi:hypothetical protein
MMGLYVHYKNGYLPSAGGILDQTAYFYQAVGLLDTWVNRIQQDMIDKNRKKMGIDKGKPGPVRSSPRKRPRKRPRRR